MNDARRKSLEGIKAKLQNAIESIGTCLDDEQNYLEGIEESQSGSEKHEEAETAIAELREAIDAIEGAIGNIESAIGD